MGRILSYFIHHPKTTLVLSILWTILIFIGCSLPGKEIPKLGLFEHFDKLVHFSFFFLFFILWKMYAFQVKFGSIIILGLAIIYGFGLEFYQMYFVAGRSFDIWDGIADGIGTISGLLFLIPNRLSYKSN